MLRFIASFSVFAVLSPFITPLGALVVAVVVFFNLK